jgi:transposase InsO family protein
MEFNMKANRPIRLIALFPALMGATAAWSHPGHQHSQGFAEALLHSVQTEWLAPVVVPLLLALAAYLYARKTNKR